MGGPTVATEPEAERLLHALQERELILATPPGEPTWKRGTRQSVIDLTFLSPFLQNRLEYCGTRDDWAMTPDHIPILIRMDLKACPQAESGRYNLQKLDRTGFLMQIERAGWESAEEPLEALQQALRAAVEQHCPRTRKSKQALHKWSPDTSRLVQDARQARRRYNATGSQWDALRYKQRSNMMKKAIRRDGRAAWRVFLEDVAHDKESDNNNALWRISKWSRRAAGETKEDPHLPALRTDEQAPLQEDPGEKAKILAAKFFPATGQADLNDIAGGSQPESSSLEVEQSVSAKTISRVLKNLPSGKAPGPDEIPNEVLKLLAQGTDEEPVTPFCHSLAQAASKVIASGTIPPCLKDSYTVALRKPGKKDYSLPSAYRPIALENTLAKVIEKILAERIVEAAEIYKLLP